MAGEMFTAVEVNRRENFSIILGALLGGMLAALIVLLCWANYNTKTYHVQAAVEPVKVNDISASLSAQVNVPALPPMPERLDLGGVEFVIDIKEFPGDAVGTLGYTRCDTRHIELNSGLEDKREVLLHEILHAYVCNSSDEYFLPFNKYYNSKSENSHEGFDRIAEVMKDALQRNPQLAAYEVGK